MADRAALDSAVGGAHRRGGRTARSCYACGLPAGPLAALFALGSRVAGAGWRSAPPGARSCGRRRRSRASSPGRRAARRRGSVPRPLRDPARGGVAAAAAFLAARARARAAPGPRAGLFDRGPRRRAGRRDTPALETAGDPRGRRRSLRSDGHRFRPHAARAEAPRPRRHAPRRACSLTHPHPDHALGLFAVLEELQVGELWRSTGEDEAGLYARLDAAAAQRRVPVRPLADRGRLGSAEGARLSVLHSGGREAQDRRDQQPVGRGALRARRPERPAHGRRRSADRGGARRRRARWRRSTRSRSAITAAGPRPRPDCSRPSRPRVALLSCGRRNRFGHPAPETLADARTRSACRSCGPTSARTRASSSLPDATRLAWRGVRRAVTADRASRRCSWSSRPDGRRARPTSRTRSPVGPRRRDRLGRRLRRVPRPRRRHGEAVARAARARSGTT